MRPIPTPELEVLVLCARMHVDPGQARRILDLLEHGLDWNRLVSITRRHGLIPLLCRTLSGLDSSHVPSETLNSLRSQHEEYRSRDLFLVSDLLNTLRTLEAAGVIATPYKGPALAACLYHDFTLRQSADVDILVRPRDAVKARRVLLEHGWRSHRHIPRFAEAAYAWLHYAFNLTTRRGVSIDLSWRIVQSFWRLPEIPDAAWDRLGRLSFAGVSVPWFAPEYLLFVLCLHGCKHKWEAMKWIVDVAEVLRKYPELAWDKLMCDAGRAGYKRMLALSLYLANDLLAAPLPDGVRDAIRGSPMVRSLADEVYDNLLDPNAQGITAQGQLRFLGRVAERIDTKLVCQILRPLYFLLHRVVRPSISALQRSLG
jgi:hypothetical protein